MEASTWKEDARSPPIQSKTDRKMDGAVVPSCDVTELNRTPPTFATRRVDGGKGTVAIVWHDERLWLPMGGLMNAARSARIVPTSGSYLETSSSPVHPKAPPMSFARTIARAG